MAFDIKIRIDGLKNTIAKITKNLENPRDMLSEIGDIIEEDVKHRIVELKRDPKETPWAPWAPGTARARQRKGNAALGLLFDTGRLLYSIKSQVKNHGRKGGWSVNVGTNVPYAKFLQEGTPKMPPRPFLGVSSRAQRAINQAVSMYLGKTVRGSYDSTYKSPEYTPKG